MSTSLLLQDKTAVIYGAGGAIGHAVARTFAREGARLLLTGRTLPKAEALAKEIAAGGGVAEAAQVNEHVRANFLTARLAGRRMVADGAGVIMTVTSLPSRIANPLMGGVALAASTPRPTGSLANSSRPWSPSGHTANACRASRKWPRSSRSSPRTGPLVSPEPWPT
ncbi:SDR family NAD(P)-dependent oxidoreductase [Actinomadura sp. 1N219]|uniref:SDR family NAD(P)-dependent oxidoreductase n=1 Tax=Actinomadura sp. 1N219 TaxID=3375152 RepID=UPI0037A824A0